MSDTPYFEKHVFFCTNTREDGRQACGHQGAQAAQKHCKSRVKQLGLNGQGKIRINNAGCLDRCAGGPVAVVYPEAVWYSWVDNSDLDEIVESHLRDGQVVERLVLPDSIGR